MWVDNAVLSYDLFSHVCLSLVLYVFLVCYLFLFYSCNWYGIHFLKKIDQCFEIRCDEDVTLIYKINIMLDSMRHETSA